MEEGEDRCGEVGTVPWKTASGDGMKRAQRRSENTKKGKNWVQGDGGNVKRRWVFQSVLGVLSERSMIIVS